jgi:hypothetical protein
MKLRSWKTDILMSSITAGGALAVRKGMKEMGWEIPYNANGIDLGTLNLNPPIFEGNYVQRAILSWHETENPAMQFILEQFKKNNRTKQDMGAWYLIGWVNAAIEHKVMNSVVQEHGWDGLTTKNLKAEMNKIKDFEPWGGLSKFTFSAKRPLPNHMRMFQVQGGKILPVSDWEEVPNFLPAE